MGPGGLGTVDGINLATPRAPGGPKFYKIRFLDGFEGSGGPGGIPNPRRMKKYPRGLILVRFAWNYEGFMLILDPR